VCNSSYVGGQRNPPYHSTVGYSGHARLFMRTTIPDNDAQLKSLEEDSCRVGHVGDPCQRSLLGSILGHVRKHFSRHHELTCRWYWVEQVWSSSTSPPSNCPTRRCAAWPLQSQSVGSAGARRFRLLTSMRFWVHAFSYPP
jgi:hypothetical protein